MTSAIAQRAVLLMVSVIFASCQSGRVQSPGTPSVISEQSAAIADQLREIERSRLRALVDGDLVTAEELHADDFHLIHNAGGTFTKQGYLEALRLGVIDYAHWEPVGEIMVRHYGVSGVLRYQADLEVVVNGRSQGRLRHWHTDVYAVRSGTWQAIWSQATEVR